MSATEFDEDSYFGQCCICGHCQDFVRNSRLIRETYRCGSCMASLREREQGRAILHCYGKLRANTVSELVTLKNFRNLHIYEPGTSGAFRKLLVGLPNYFQSDFYDASDRLDASATLPHQSLEKLSYDDEIFDLIITSDILEHVRRPNVAFSEIFRVLKPGGWHVFTVPLQHPLPAASLIRVDTSSDKDLHLLEPRYHGNGKGGKSLVYTDFGSDILEMLSAKGFISELWRADKGSDIANRVYTVISRKPTH